VLEAENGKEALEKLKGLDKVGISIQLFLSDWNMPEMNGIDFLLSLKKDPKYSKVPFLMVTTESESENVMKAIVLGVTDFIIKPFDEGTLEDKLTSIWKRTHEKG
jgi:two-component system chemotaxis response regulator CheY